MKKMYTLAAAWVFAVFIGLGSIMSSQPALASDRSIALSLSTSVSVELPSTAGKWPIAQASDSEEVPGEALVGLPTGATLDEEAAAPQGCTKEGFFPVPSDCKKFRRCVFNPNFNSYTEYIFDCAPGTDLWCQELLTCSFSFQCPSSSGCGS